MQRMAVGRENSTRVQDRQRAPIGPVLLAAASVMLGAAAGAPSPGISPDPSGQPALLQSVPAVARAPRGIAASNAIAVPEAAVQAGAPVVFGRSVCGAPLVAYVFDGGGSDTTLVVGGVHGDERAGPGVVERLREELRRSPAAWRGRRVLLVPRMNPDGLRAGTRVNAHGVDLNRNLPQGWLSRARGRRYHPGSCPASEPETQALMALIARWSPSKVISIHQPFGYLDYTGRRGRTLAAEMRRHNGYRMVNGNVRILPGCLGGYCGVRLGLAMVTLELPRGDTSAAWRRNRGALLAAIRFDAP